MPRKSPPPFKGFRLLALDPGERTGYCVAAVHSSFRRRDGRGFEIQDQGVLTIPELWDALPELVGIVDRVAYETWRLYPEYAQAFIGNDMQPSQAVGAIRYEAHRQGTPISSNGASIKTVAVATMPEWLVEHLAKSSEQHDQDAIMHAWYVAVLRLSKHQRASQ